MEAQAGLAPAPPWQPAGSATNTPHRISGKKSSALGVLSAVWVCSAFFCFYPSSLASLPGPGLLTQRNPSHPCALQTLKREMVLNKVMKKSISISKHVSFNPTDFHFVGVYFCPGLCRDLGFCTHVRSHSPVTSAVSVTPAFVSAASRWANMGYSSPGLDNKEALNYSEQKGSS